MWATHTPHCFRYVGKLDESNIILGKHRRRKIDYALLNDSMLGALSAADLAKIDDEVEFQYKPPTRRETSSSGSDDDGNDSGGEESSDGSSREGDDNNDETETALRGKRKVQWASRKITKMTQPTVRKRSKKGEDSPNMISQSGTRSHGRHTTNTTSSSSSAPTRQESKKATLTKAKPQKPKSERNAKVPRSKSKQEALSPPTSQSSRPTRKRIKTR